jgi:hypothetical protein
METLREKNEKKKESKKHTTNDKQENGRERKIKTEMQRKIKT